MESLIKDVIIQHIDLHNLIKSSQHGFMKGKLCTTNLLEFLEKVMRNIDSNIPMDIIYLDFLKVFDKVSINKLDLDLAASLLEILSKYADDTSLVTLYQILKIRATPTTA